jgi:hypothetical protein
MAESDVNFVGGAGPAVGFEDIIKYNPHCAIDEFYKYTGHVLDGTFLVPHTIESDKKYTERRRAAYNVNYLAPCIDAIARPIFDGKITRTTDSEMLKAFWQDMDCRGSEASAFMRRTCEEVLKHSTYFIIMDNYSEDQQPKTEAEAIKDRIFPYVYPKKPQDVADFVLTDRGAVESITFHNGKTTVDKKERCVFLRIDAYSFRQFWIEQGSGGTKIEHEISDVPHPLGRLPIIIPRNAIPEDGELCAHPKAYGLMRICHAMFNKDSEMRELERKQMFSMLAIEQKGASEPKNMGVGSANVMYYADGAKPPQFVEPNPNILLGLLQTTQNLRESFAMVAGQAGVVGIKQASSGMQAAYEFMGRESEIKELAEISETTEKQTDQMFLDWINSSDTFTVEYPESYTPADDAAQIKWADMVLMNRDSLPASVVSDAALMIAMKIRPSMTDEDIEIVKEEIRLAGDQNVKTEFDLNNGEPVDGVGVGE